MKNRVFKLLAFTLAVMLVVGLASSPVSAATVCEHENRVLDHYSYEYEYGNESNHLVYTWSWYRCTACNNTEGSLASCTLEAHTFGSETPTGNNYHSGKVHIYETVSTCVSCRHEKYGKVAFACNGDGTNCPTLIF